MNKIQRGTPSKCQRPFDGRWATGETIAEEFGISKRITKKLSLDGWIRSRTIKTTGKHGKIIESITLYSFEDVHQYLEIMAHEPSQVYVDRFWAAIIDGRDKRP